MVRPTPMFPFKHPIRYTLERKDGPTTHVVQATVPLKGESVADMHRRNALITGYQVLRDLQEYKQVILTVED